MGSFYKQRLSNNYINAFFRIFSYKKSLPLNAINTINVNDKYNNILYKCQGYPIFSQDYTDKNAYKLWEPLQRINR